MAKVRDLGNGFGETIFDVEPGFRREHLWIFVSILALYFVVRVVLPTDLYSTALWLDAFQRPTPWGDATIDSAIYRFLDDLIPINVSVEGMTFSVLLTLTQMMMTLKMVSAGPWVKNGEDPGFFAVFFRVFRNILGKKTNTIRPENLNGLKFAYFFAWLFVVVFDSYTGLSYRLTGDTVPLPVWQKVMIGITYAILYENILSEILLGESIRGILTVTWITLMTIPATRELTTNWREKWDKAAPSPRQPNQPRPPRDDRPRGPQPAETRSDRPPMRDSGGAPNGRPHNRPPMNQPPTRRPPPPLMVTLDEEGGEDDILTGSSPGPPTFDSLLTAAALRGTGITERTLA